jgi:hypothetical protein
MRPAGLPPSTCALLAIVLLRHEEFLAVLSPEASAFYGTVQQTLDIFYPVLSLCTLFFAIAALTPKAARIMAMGRRKSRVAGAIFDYLENHAVGDMLAVGAGRLTAEMVANASQWTVLKSGATALTMTILLVWLCLYGARAAAGIRRSPNTRQTSLR